ncbi:MAG TPA: type II CRISPR RNA-guided endonuclease Cas9 [Rhodobacteraceae bacterium]|nr:type II CRISPR RNA-guided endonuclease Cas9 [Paracoccaceae bacterium]
MRLGLDIGTSSIGWWLYRLEGGKPTAAIDGGVRIFSDGRGAKTGASLAVARREARAVRRRRDRYLRRRTVLMQRLAEAGLMPADPATAKALEGLDPYTLRANGLDEKLPLTHFGRALFHLNQRRGFKSNRKTDRSNEEGGMIQSGTERLDQAMMVNHARTLGEFLHMRRQKAETPRHTLPVRTRTTTLTLANNKVETIYDFYPDRRHLEEEFHKLWQAQAALHPELTDALRDTLFETIFYQRPLKAPKVGLCLFTDERRLPKAHPLTQRRVLYETINNLRVVANGRAKRPLTLEQRNEIIHALDNKKHTKNLSGMKLALKALGKLLKLRTGESFSLDTAARDSIACDPVRASLSHPDCFGGKWSGFSLDEQWKIITRLQEEQEQDALLAWLTSSYGLDAAHALNTAKTNLPEGYSRLGDTATRNILAHLEAEVLTYNQAVESCGWHHSNERTGEILDALPYYGKILERHVIPGSYDENDDDITRFGRITNPTVHIGLNQVRRLVNKIIEVHGKPEQIVVELARELKQNDRQKTEIQKTIKANTNAAIERSKKLEELGVPDTGANRARLRLWEELGPAIGPRCCPYTGKTISANMVFTAACDIDHILPFSRTLDDSFANRTLCLKEANRVKRNKTPWESWGETAQWVNIEANLKNLPHNKRWRFAPDAMQRFEGENDFTSRALNDTAYLSKIAKAYLEALYTEGGHVWVVPGRLTEMLRRHWGLNFHFGSDSSTAKAKNRHDHRHHAIDAAVIAATDRGLIQRIAKLTEDHVEENREAFAKATPPPWEHFRKDTRAHLERITISHRADHGRIDPSARKQGRDTTTGALHKDTAYGLTSQDKNGVQCVVHRKPIDSLTPAMIAKIRDLDLQSALKAATSGKTGKALEARLKEFSTQDGPYKGIRRARIIEPKRTISIQSQSGGTYKGYSPGGNHRYEIWQMPEGKYIAWVVPNYYAHKSDLPLDFRPASPNTCKRPHPAAHMVTRLQQGDMVAFEQTNKFGAIIAVVAKFDATGTIELVPHNETNADNRYSESKKARKANLDLQLDDVYIRLAPSTFIKAGGRRVYVDEIGQVRDPGPR